MFTSPFDSQVSFVTTVSGSVPPDFPLDRYESRYGERMAATRKNLFIAGRAAAHRAIAQLGVTFNDLIDIGDNREPCWPTDLTGSISHTDQIAVAAIARRSDYRAIGVDIEDTSRVFKYDISAKICCESEREWIHAEGEASLRTVALFSAKEAVFKALHPIVKSYISFLDVVLTERDAATFNATLQRDLHETLPAGMNLKVSYNYSDKLILTAIALTQTQQC